MTSFCFIEFHDGVEFSATPSGAQLRQALELRQKYCDLPKKQQGPRLQMLVVHHSVWHCRVLEDLFSKLSEIGVVLERWPDASSKLDSKNQQDDHPIVGSHTGEANSARNMPLHLRGERQ